MLSKKCADREDITLVRDDKLFSETFEVAETFISFSQK